MASWNAKSRFFFGVMIWYRHLLIRFFFKKKKLCYWLEKKKWRAVKAAVSDRKATKMNKHSLINPANTTFVLYTHLERIDRSIGSAFWIFQFSKKTWLYISISIFDPLAANFVYTTSMISPSRISFEYIPRGWQKKNATHKLVPVTI